MNSASLNTRLVLRLGAHLEVNFPSRVINAKPAEIRAFLHNQLPPGREQKLKEQLIKGGVPL